MRLGREEHAQASKTRPGLDSSTSAGRHRGALTVVEPTISVPLRVEALRGRRDYGEVAVATPVGDLQDERWSALVTLPNSAIIASTHMTSGYRTPHHFVANSAEEAFSATLRCLLEHGERIEAGPSRSVGAERVTIELLNFSVIVHSPADRIVDGPHRRLNLPVAIARFVWLMAGSDRLHDIAFYEPRVRRFSDDGLTIPGSNFGQRILHARPGLNQLDATLRRLRNDRSTRRAAIAIYQPEDAARDSGDIPCAFGLTYAIREGALHATTLMRSSNAFGLFPYDFFEFSMLAEVIAAELGIPLASVTHFAASTHFYEEDVTAVRAIATQPSTATSQKLPMPTMPRTPRPTEQLTTLVELEWKLRHHAFTEEGSGPLFDEAKRRLDGYWLSLYLVLLSFVLRQRGRDAESVAVSALLPAPFEALLRCN